MYNTFTHLTPQEANTGENFQRFARLAPIRLMMKYEQLEDANHHQANGRAVSVFLHCLDNGKLPEAGREAWAQYKEEGWA